MKEYQIKTNITEEQLNRFASEGWEIISVYPMSYTQISINEHTVTQLGATMCREKNQSEPTKNIRRYRKVEDRFKKRLMVEDTLKQILEDRFGVDRALVNDDTTPYEMGMDSLDTVEYMMEVERTYKIDIKDEDFHHDNISFSSVVDFIISKMSHRT